MYNGVKHVRFENSILKNEETTGYTSFRGLRCFEDVDRSSCYCSIFGQWIGWVLLVGFSICSRFLQLRSVHEVFIIGNLGFMLPSATANCSKLYCFKTALETFP